MAVSEQELNDFLNPIYKSIEKNGYYLQGATDSKSKYKTFFFTIGLWQSYGLPEIICFGLPNKTCVTLLNEACSKIKSGERIETNTDYHDFLKKGAVRFKKVHPSHFFKYVGIAWSLSKSEEFGALQLIWSDENFKYPWQKGFNSTFSGMQRLLYKPK